MLKLTKSKPGSSLFAKVPVKWLYRREFAKQIRIGPNNIGEGLVRG